MKLCMYTLPRRYRILRFLLSLCVIRSRNLCEIIRIALRERYLRLIFHAFAYCIFELLLHSYYGSS